MRLTSSGSSASERCVKPTRSQKSTVTTLRSSRGAVGADSSAPQWAQRGKPAGVVFPHVGHVIVLTRLSPTGARPGRRSAWRLPSARTRAPAAAPRRPRHAALRPRAAPPRAVAPPPLRAGTACSRRSPPRRGSALRLSILRLPGERERPLDVGECALEVVPAEADERPERPCLILHVVRGRLAL